jgi:hypothetical protein
MPPGKGKARELDRSRTLTTWMRTTAGVDTSVLARVDIYPSTVGWRPFSRHSGCVGELRRDCVRILAKYGSQEAG